MIQTKANYYRENPDKFLEEFLPNLNLHEYQIEFLKKIIKDPNIPLVLLNGRGNHKRMLGYALGVIVKELYSNNKK